jgi:hypothetical protein
VRALPGPTSQGRCSRLVCPASCLPVFPLTLSLPESQPVHPMCAHQGPVSAIVPYEPPIRCRDLLPLCVRAASNPGTRPQPWQCWQHRSVSSTIPTAGRLDSAHALADYGGEHVTMMRDDVIWRSRELARSTPHPFTPAPGTSRRRTRVAVMRARHIDEIFRHLGCWPVARTRSPLSLHHSDEIMHVKSCAILATVVDAGPWPAI